eukprot:CAMPEP_0206535834 /NCGR_PEP_ID=MMETSP0325_2-20121206/6380_1 /ASSEMBLY_ACC=CAM_ASM_000347 /TAXON_ID=2866 /ORGANISM="Crypthecodinium cohnii, Strain Seligo" /LENGTH=1238 /DNA_ID=CAMNT_0054032911 /DNA_START=154 /DNA_END=3867 /DNA_ORIENTATION=+
MTPENMWDWKSGASDYQPAFAGFCGAPTPMGCMPGVMMAPTNGFQDGMNGGVNFQMAQQQGTRLDGCLGPTPTLFVPEYGTPMAAQMAGPCAGLINGNSSSSFSGGPKNPAFGPTMVSFVPVPMPSGPQPQVWSNTNNNTNNPSDFNYNTNYDTNFNTNDSSSSNINFASGHSIGDMNGSGSGCAASGYNSWGNSSGNQPTTSLVGGPAAARSRHRETFGQEVPEEATSSSSSSSSSRPRPDQTQKNSSNTSSGSQSHSNSRPNSAPHPHFGAPNSHSGPRLFGAGGVAGGLSGRAAAQASGGVLPRAGQGQGQGCQGQGQSEREARDAGNGGASGGAAPAAGSLFGAWRDIDRMLRALEKRAGHPLTTRARESMDDLSLDEAQEVICHCIDVLEEEPGVDLSSVLLIATRRIKIHATTTPTASADEGIIPGSSNSARRPAQDPTDNKPSGDWGTNIRSDVDGRSAQDVSLKRKPREDHRTLFLKRQNATLNPERSAKGMGGPKPGSNWTAHSFDRLSVAGGGAFFLKQGSDNKWFLRINMSDLEGLTDEAVQIYCPWLHQRLIRVREDCRLRSLRSLRAEVSFSRNSLSDGAVVRLLQALRRSDMHIASLNFQYNCIGSRGAREFGEFFCDASAPSIRELNLAGNMIDDLAAEQLIRSIAEHPRQLNSWGSHDREGQIVPLMLRLNNNWIRDPMAVLRKVAADIGGSISSSNRTVNGPTLNGWLTLSRFDLQDEPTYLQKTEVNASGQQVLDALREVSGPQTPRLGAQSIAASLQSNRVSGSSSSSSSSCSSSSSTNSASNNNSNNSSSSSNAVSSLYSSLNGGNGAAGNGSSVSARPLLRRPRPRRALARGCRPPREPRTGGSGSSSSTEDLMSAPLVAIPELSSDVEASSPEMEPSSPPTSPVHLSLDDKEDDCEARTSGDDTGSTAETRCRSPPTGATQGSSPSSEREGQPEQTPEPSGADQDVIIKNEGSITSGGDETTTPAVEIRPSNPPRILQRKRPEARSPERSSTPATNATQPTKQVLGSEGSHRKPEQDRPESQPNAEKSQNFSEISGKNSEKTSEKRSEDAIPKLQQQQQQKEDTPREMVLISSRPCHSMMRGSRVLTSIQPATTTTTNPEKVEPTEQLKSPEDQTRSPSPSSDGDKRDEEVEETTCAVIKKAPPKVLQRASRAPEESQRTPSPDWEANLELEGWQIETGVTRMLQQRSDLLMLVWLLLVMVLLLVCLCLCSSSSSL